MSCQGCGRNATTTRLCCPTCIEFGRTSFFCGQECFTSNWAAHNQLHDLLRKKQKEELQGGGVASDEGSGGAAARPKAGSGSTASTGSRALPPLPGGTPLVNNASSAAASSKKRDDVGTSAASFGVFGSLVSRAKAALGGPAGVGSAQGGKPRFAGGGQQPSSGSTSRATTGGGSTRPGTTLAAPGKTRQFTVQQGLWFLAVLTVTAGFIFYRESQRYSFGQQPDLSPDQSGVTPPGAAAVVGVTGAGGEEASAAAAVADISDIGASPVSVSALHAEISALRELVERHDKMLRYVMDRYVEKTGDTGINEGAAVGARPFATHEASAVNFSAPEFISKSYTDGAAGRLGDNLRKRKSGGEASSAFGLPELEGGENAATSASVEGAAGSAM